MIYLLVKWVHVVSSTFLFGTGVGSAFYMLFGSLTRDVRAVAVISRFVVIADWTFTVPTIILQPLTGLYLAHLAHFPLSSRWILESIVLYCLAGICWLPVVWIQIQMRNMARAASTNNNALPERYWQLLRFWTVLGIIAFVALVRVYYLMVTKGA